MTDKKNEEQLISSEDEQLLASFFEDCKMDELADDGFSDRVMESLPAPSPTHRLEMWWMIACTVAGVAFLLKQNIWGYLVNGVRNVDDSIFSFKIEGLMNLSHAVSDMGSVFSHLNFNEQNTLTIVAGLVVIALVWGYNQIMDARA